MPRLRQDIVQWLFTQDYWVRFLGNAILHKGCINERDEESAFGYLLQQNGLAEKTPEVPLSSIAISENTTEATESVVLAGMKDLKNVNALAPGQELTFGNGITAIYGNNGVGKSGYTRMLNNAFRSRGDTEILPDIRSEEEMGQPSCTFLFLKNHEELPLTYPEKGDHPFFRAYTVFDTKSMRVHVDKENHLHFSPQGFEFFDELAAAVDSLKERLQSTIAERRTENSFVQHFEGESPVKAAIAGLSGTSDLKKVRESAQWTDADGDREKALSEKLVSLQPAQFEKSKKTLNLALETAKRFAQQCEALNRALSEENLKKHKDTLLAHKGLQERARAEGAEQFKTGKIQGVGSGEWRRFIQAAHDFGKKNEGYPREGSHCLLCQQPLLDDARSLIERLFRHLASTVATEINQVQQSIKGATQAMESLAQPDLPTDSVLRQWLNEHKAADISAIEQDIERVWKSCECPRECLSELKHDVDISPVAVGIEALQTAQKTLVDQIGELKGQEANLNQERRKVEDELRILRHKKQLSSILPHVEEYVKKYAWADKAEKITLNTGFITRVQRPLFEKYVTDDYRARFADECKRLDAHRFGVQVVQKGAKGRTTRKLKLGSYDPGKVLSEGEQRAIALADFLTEAIMDPANCGIILDDPVNSLDHVRKEQIAYRLAEEGKARQVIIFTHDLVFLYKVKTAAEKAASDFVCHWMECREDSVGVVALNNSPSNERDYKNPDKAIAYWQRAKASEPEVREVWLRQGFSALRTTYETFVIHTLLADVVKRIDEQVRFGNLKKIRITPEIIERADAKFAQLSRYIEGHSHSDEYAGTTPTPDMLKKEIDDFVELKREHKALLNRQVPNPQTGFVPKAS